MQINKVTLEDILGPFTTDQETKVSLFIVSKKNSRLKKLDLDPALTVEKRAAKLHQWAQQQRFIAVIEMGDQIFAHAHAKVAQELDLQKDLSVQGKQVQIKVMTDAEAEKLASVITMLGENVVQPDEKIEEDTSTAHVRHQKKLPSLLQENHLIVNQDHVIYRIAQLKNDLAQIIINCFKRFNEELQESKKQQEADDKYFRIKQGEIQKADLKSEIKKEEIAQSERRRQV